MKELIIDARGLKCPQPVIKTKKALEEVAEEGTLLVMVDNEAARTNIANMSSSKGYRVDVEEKEGEYHISITREGADCYLCDLKDKTVIVIGNDVLGGGSEELGKILMNSYIYTLLESDAPPQALIFINKGVFLTTEGSEVLEDLIKLEKRGVEILSCGTCLDFFQKKDMLKIGKITNMYTITEKMAEADKTFTF